MQNELVKNEKSNVVSAFFSFADVIATAFILLLAVFTFAVRTSWVIGDSMNPTLRNGEFLLITAMPHDLEHGDIVVISDTGHNLPQQHPIVKRVIGLPGDTIDINFTSGVVYRNGEALEESYTAMPTYSTRYLGGNTTFPCVVPEGRCFIMGDNRGNSADSRALQVGMVDQRDVLGVRVGNNKAGK